MTLAQGIKQKRYKEGNRFSWKIKFFFWLFIFASIFAILVFVSRLELVNISFVEIQGNELVADAELIQIANDKMADNLFYFFPKSNVLLIPSDDIRREIGEKFPSFHNIRVYINGVNTLRIAVSERAPAYLVCVEKNSEEHDLVLPDNFFHDVLNENCFFMDEGGFVFQSAPNFSDTVYRKFITQSVSLSEQIAGSKREFLHLNETISALESNGALIKRVILGELFTILHLSGIRNYKNTMDSRIFFDHSVDTEEISNLFNLLLGQDKFRDELAGEKPLEYIDLRINDRLIYRFAVDDAPDNDQEEPNVDQDADISFE